MTDFWRPRRIDETRFELLASTAGCVGPPGHQMFMGGVTTAAAIAACQEATDLPVVWCSAQFLGRTMDGDQIDIEVEFRPGRTITQATVTLRTSGRTTSVVQAALGQGDRVEETEQFTTLGSVRLPQDAVAKPGGPWATPSNLLGIVERRTALQDPTLGREQLWLRLSDQEPVTPSELAIFAEFMPGAHPSTQGGSGLDLTIRFVRHVPTTWVLLDTQLVASANGLFHSDARLYAEGGEFLAVASQTGRLPR